MPRSIAAPPPPRPPLHDTADRLPAPGDEPPAQRRRQSGEASLGGVGTTPPPRRPGPSLPMTAARAALWSHAQQPLLLDNTGELRRTGCDPRAHLLPGEAARHPASAPTPGELFLPVALPVPPAPQAVMPPGEPAALAAQRRQVVDWLGQLRRVAAEVHAEGGSPDDEADAFFKLDKLAMPAVAAALNAEDPQLRLVYAHVDVPDDRGVVRHDKDGFGSVAWQAFMNGAAPGRWRVLLDNGTHNLALDLQIAGPPGDAGRRGSVVHLNPSVAQNADPVLDAAEMASHLGLPGDWLLLMVDVPAQKCLRSCRIFALSMALKCHRDPSMEALHAQRLRGEPPAFATMDLDAQLLLPADYSSESDRDSDDEGDGPPGAARPSGSAPPSGLLAHYATSAADLLGLPYMKHAQSRGAVQDYLARRPQDAGQPVNGKGQTLLQRHDAHRVARWPRSGARRSGPLLQSASIELKRIAFLDKAIRHAARCDAAQVRSLCTSMEAVDARWEDPYLR